MAQSTRTIKVDDLTGTEIEDGAGETIMFSVDGVDYQIDLDDKNAAKFHKALEPFVNGATRLGRTRSGRKAVRRTATDADPAAVRAWAESNGYEVSPRGRIRAEVLEAYRTAGN